MSYGAQIKFAIAKQASGGTGATAAGSFHHFPIISEDVGLEKEEVVSANLTGRFEQGAVYDGVNRISGTIEFEPTPKALGAILTAICGSASEVTSGSLKTRTWFPNTVDFSSTLITPPYTIYKQFTDAASAEHYYDVQIGAIEFSFSQGQLLRARATVAGGTRTATGIGSLGITLDTADLQLGYLWDVCSISYGGSAVGMYSDITVSLNETIAPLYTLNGTMAPYKFTRTGFREVTVNGTMYFADRVAFNDFVAGAQKRLIVSAIAKKTVVQVPGSYYAMLEIDVPQLKITQMKPGASGPGEVSVSFTGRGVTDTNSNYAIKFTAANTFAGPY